MLIFIILTVLMLIMPVLVATTVCGTSGCFWREDDRDISCMEYIDHLLWWNHLMKYVICTFWAILLLGMIGLLF